MPSFAPPIPDVRPAQENLFPSRFAIALGLAGLADWLFYGERIGISFALFAIALMACSLLANRAATDGRRMLLAGLVLIAGIIPAIEELNLLSFAFAVLALGVGVLVTTNPDTTGLADRVRALLGFFLFGPFRLIRDAAGSFNVPAIATGFVVWFVPIVLGSVFVVLFASANPLIEKWFAQLNPGNAASQVTLARLLFWLVALSIVWPFIHVARIALQRSDDWLIRANLITLTGALYICSLVNFAAIIADYNVAHSREASGKGVMIDMHYLSLLGPQALPALDKAFQLRAVDTSLVSHRNSLVERLRQDTASWRAWSFRGWRLHRYVAAQDKQQTPTGWAQ
jgi:Domain of unknown function (DUF4153)